MSSPETRYAKSGDISIACQVSGSGPLDLIFVPGFVSNLDVRVGLICYGASLVDQFQQAAGYVERILRGTRAADLPVGQPTKFEFVINLKTAKALGLAPSTSLLSRADEMIEQATRGAGERSARWGHVLKLEPRER